MRRTATGIGALLLWSVSAFAAEGPTELGWGTDLTFRAAVPEAQARGPSAIAVDAQGKTWVLDRLGGRVVRVGRRVEAQLPVGEDSELFAIGNDGVVATYSALRSRVELISATGASLGSIAVPRALGPIGAIALGASNRVSVTVALQERFELGSPRFPLPLEVTLQGKHEGAYALSDGRGVAIVVRKGQPSLLLNTSRAGKPGAAMDDKAIVATLPLRASADAAQLVGVDGTIACARLESLRPGVAIDVARRLVCVDVTTGTLALDQALPSPGAYAPRSELAVGGGQVALMRPSATGLTITRWSLRGGAR